MSELQFHPENPNHFFTCSSLGELWHWDAASQLHSQPLNAAQDRSAGGLNYNERLNVTALASPLYLPLNSLHVAGESVITTCDNEAAYIITKPLSVL